jgi:hypothetical protein
MRLGQLRLRQGDIRDALRRMDLEEQDLETDPDLTLALDRVAELGTERVRLAAQLAFLERVIDKESALDQVAIDAESRRIAEEAPRKQRSEDKTGEPNVFRAGTWPTGPRP